ncbi:hypothetical protein [Klebsiella quasipneumoniae]|uniref:hypothetical protein n=1 Tax=Klebsiella quasipneumoniae TaxID=1463165 RepID=UPI00352A84B0
MKTINISVSEWLGLVTITSALYSYIYYYRFWSFFGINAYDYFSYIDALQHSVPSIIFALCVTQAFTLFLVCLFIFAKKNLLSFYRYSSYLAETNFYNKILKISICMFVLIFISGFFVGRFLKSGIFIPGVSYKIVAILSSILICSGSVSFATFLMLNSIRNGDSMKKSLVIFYLSQTPLQLFFSAFYLPVTNAFYFKIYDKAQVVYKDNGVLKTERLLGITKDFYIVMDGGRGVVRKTDTLQYVIYDDK